MDQLSFLLLLLTLIEGRKFIGSEFLVSQRNFYKIVFVIVGRNAVQLCGCVTFLSVLGFLCCEQSCSSLGSLHSQHRFLSNFIRGLDMACNVSYKLGASECCVITIATDDFI